MSAVMADPLPEEVFEPHEAAVVVYARRSTLMQPIDDHIWSALTRHFDTKQIMEIIFTVGFDQMISRFHAAVHTEVDASTRGAVESDPPVPLPDTPTGDP